MRIVERIPFFRLLLPLLAGIIAQYYLFVNKWSVVALLLGLAVMLLSYFISAKKEFALRWVYGCGLFLFLFGVGCISTEIRQKLCSYNFLEANTSYLGVITDIPQEKPNSFAYKIQLKNIDREIICYISKDDESRKLGVGDEILFFSEIKPFVDNSSSDEFSYAKYIYNKGYSGYAFVNEDRWEKTGENKNNLFIKGVQFRQKILNFYASLGLNDDEYAILSALTLGHKDALSDDLVQSFRITGTAHLLAISGMHVGVFYLVLLSLLRLIPLRGDKVWIRWCVLVLFLWTYVFIIGFPASAVRACIMLTLFCFAQLQETKVYSLNILFIAGFFMLLWNPFWLFDLGFQLSFMAVLSMLILLPVISQKVYVKNRLLRYFWNVLLVSLVVQLGTLPLCIYYFGTFPTYFFLTNLFVIPLITLIIYDGALLLLLSLVGDLLPILTGYLLFLPLTFYKYLVWLSTRCIRFFEKLPFAQIENLNITLVQLFLVWFAVVYFIGFVFKKKAKILQCSLSFLLLFMLSVISVKVEERNSLKIHNGMDKVLISYNINFVSNRLLGFSENELLLLNNKRYLILVNDDWKEKTSFRKFDIDYLHIVDDNSASLHSLIHKFNLRHIILDDRLSAKTIKRLTLECEKLRIPYYDVSKKGSLRIFF